MAWIECRAGSWRVVFRFKDGRHAFTVGDVDMTEASIWKAQTEELLRLLKRNLITIPPGCSIEQFMFYRGKPPEDVPLPKKELTLGELRDEYFRSQQDKLEQTTLDGIHLHFDHLTRILGHKRIIPTTIRADLQDYVDTRAGEWIDPNVYRRKRREKLAAAQPKRKYKRRRQPRQEPPDKPLRHPSAATIKKEIISLRTAWNWARRHLGLIEEFPGTHLSYAKVEESLPFMTWEEAERRIDAGDDPEQIWDCVYLKKGEIEELLEWVKIRPVSPWVYPMFCFAAHTGARRSEIVRALPSDVDLANGVMTIREKKRDKRKLTTRRVPLTPFLKEVLADWMKQRAKGRTLFCKTDGKEITPREAHNYFQRGLRLSKWAVLRGWHVFRHSFVSALASQGVDQRIIDDLVGHMTEQQSRRYRHLYPNVVEQALRSALG